MVYKIAILITKMSKIHQMIVNAFKEKLLEHPDSQKCEIEVFEVYGAGPSLIERHVRHIILEEFDLIVPIGTYCALGAVKETSLRRHKTPVIFTAVSHPVDNGIIESWHEKADHVTGVCHEQQPDLLPLEMILIMNPNLFRFIIPYRTMGIDGRNAFKVWKMKKYLKTLGRKVFDVLIEKDDSVEQKIETFIENGDAIAIPAGGMLASDVPSLDAISKKYHAHLFGDASGIIPQTALFLSLIHI